MTNQASAAPKTLPLLPTKLYPTDTQDRPLLPRQVLLDRLFEARKQRLIMLSAPAGFGKSTVLSQFRLRLQQDGALVAWLSCDESDSEPQRFLQYLIAAIALQLPGFGQGTKQLLRSEVSLSNDTLLESFIDELGKVERDLYLMFDDVHRIRHAELGTLIHYFLTQAPANVRMIGSSRYQPSFLEAQSADAPWALWVKASDLRLTREETRTYFHELKGIDLSDAELAQLHGRTEGWITALHLVALALARHPDRTAFLAGLSGTERDIADYLAEDVVDSLPADQQRFLDQTSVLDEFNAELCNALTGRTDAEQMLQRLHKEQLFLIGLDEQGTWFRYHHLFAEFLQGRLSRQGDSGNLLHAAARWCEHHELYDKSAKYALRARDYSFAAGLLERQGANLIAANRVYGILAILKDIPAEVMREYPVFQIFYAWQLAFEQRYAEAEALIEDVSTRLLEGRGQPIHFGLAMLLAVAQVLKALVLLYQDKLEACLKVARHWLALVPDNQPVFRASLSCVQAAAFALLGEYGQAGKSIAVAENSLRQQDSAYLQAVVSLIQALICKEVGQPAQGCQQAEQARAEVERVFGRRSRVGGPLALAYADLLYEQDRHAAILAELPLATTWRDVATPIELISRGKLVMAKARFFAGEAEQTLVELDEWLSSLQGPGYERVYALGMGCKVQFLLWLRRASDAERICLQMQQHLAVLPAGRFSDAEMAQALAEARLALAERRADKAQAALEACLAKQTAEHHRDRRVRLTLLLSVAYWRKGNSEKAFAALEKTLVDAWSSGYRRLFLDDALWLLPLLEAWLEAEPKQLSHWQGLREQLREQCRRLNVDSEKIEENQDVSHREREILRFVAAGLSNRDIAQAVHLSEATIKWHLHNLFAKLGVRSRTQAVLKGKSLGLLSNA